MQLVGSPNIYTEKFFNNLCTSQNFIKSLMTTDSLGRMDFLAHKISEEIKVKFQKYNITIIFYIILKGQSFLPFLGQRLNSLLRKLSCYVSE